MGRPLKGTITTKDERFVAEVPAAIGSPQRIRRTFDSHHRAQLWVHDAIAAIRSGRPVPEPTAARRQQSPRAARAGANISPTQFEEVAHRYMREVYLDGAAAGPDRIRSLQAILINHLFPWARAHCVESGADITREMYLAYLRSLAGCDQVAPLSVATPLGADLTKQQSAQQCGVSMSTIKRALARGAFPDWRRDPHGRVLIPTGNLIDAGLMEAPGRRGRPSPIHGYSTAYAKSIRSLLCAILKYGATPGIERWQLSFDPDSVKTPIRIADTSDGESGRGQLTLTKAAALAKHLHPVHQLAFWLQRILGLRIGEAYGLRVGDIHESAFEIRVVAVRTQGGRQFPTIDRSTGEFGNQPRSTHLKSTNAYRLVTIPAPLMHLIDTTIRIFHTDTDGTVNDDRRLIPGLRSSDTGGQAAFRAALAEAARDLDLDLKRDTTRRASVGTERPGDPPGSGVRPHDLRKGAATDAKWKTTADPLALRRALGHSAGTDVHEQVYLLDDPDLLPIVHIARELGDLINRELPKGLMVPTTVRCTTKSQPALASRATDIDDALHDVGWLTTSRIDGERMVTTSDVADLAGVSLGTARRWLRDGAIDSVVDERGHRRAVLSDAMNLVEAFGDHRDLADLAQETGENYSYLYQRVVSGSLEHRRIGRRIAIPDSTWNTVTDHIAICRTLEDTALTVDAVADRLGLTAASVENLIRTGALSVLPSRGRNNRRYVAFDEIDRFRSSSIGRARLRRQRRRSRPTAAL